MNYNDIKFYNKRLLKIDFALESYEDFYGSKIEGLTELRKELKDFRLTKEKMTEEEKYVNTKRLVEAYIKLIETKIGKDKFEFYDDGDVLCKVNN